MSLLNNQGVPMEQKFRSLRFVAPCSWHPCQFLDGIPAATPWDKAGVTRDTTSIFIEIRFRFGDSIVYVFLSDCSTQHGHVLTWSLHVKHENPWLRFIRITVGFIVAFDHSATCQRAMPLDEQATFEHESQVAHWHALVGSHRRIAPRCQKPGTFRLLCACDGFIGFYGVEQYDLSIALTCTAIDVAT